MNTGEFGAVYRPAPLNRPKYYLSVPVLIACIFFFFLEYIYVNGQPFGGKVAGEFQAAEVDATQGDIVRQVFYITTFLVVLALTLPFAWKRILVQFSPALIMLFAWALISSVWAVDPFVSFKRSVLATIAIVITATTVIYLGRSRALTLVYYSLIFLFICNFLSVIAMPELAVHTGAEKDRALVGAWRGIMPHKNHASAITAVSMIVFGYLAVTRRRVIDVVLFLSAVVFLIGTKGKTATAFVFPCLLTSLFYLYLLRFQGGRLMFFIFGLVMAITGLALAGVFSAQISDILSNPKSFTGRVAIWEIVLSYANINPWLGAGFGTFWQVGDKSPALAMSTPYQWSGNVAHSHNGYLELLATTGIPGLLLGLYACVFQPVYIALTVSPRYRKIVGLLLGIWMFAVLYNLLETHIMTRDRQIWIIMIVILQSMYMISLENMQQVRKKRYAPRLWSRTRAGSAA